MPHASCTLWNRAELERIAAKAIDERVFPGCVAGLVDRDGNRELVCAGKYRYDDGPAMHGQSVFDIASVTKVIPTSTLAIMFLDEGKLGLHEPVARYVPELRTTKVTIWHLLTHTVDFGLRFSSLKNKTPAQILDQLYAASSISAPPGSSFAYSNAASLLLGIAVERVAGQALDTLSNERLFGPLGMHSTSFEPDSLLSAAIVPTEQDPWRERDICGEIHDESAWKLRTAMVPGSAGLFSTAPDLLVFLECLLRGGNKGDARILPEGLLGRAATNQIEHLGQIAGLGWEMGQRRYMGDHAPGIIGKTGFTGCVIMAHASSERAMVLLSNCTWPRRKQDRACINEVRAAMANAAFAGL